MNKDNYYYIVKLDLFLMNELIKRGRYIQFINWLGKSLFSNSKMYNILIYTNTKVQVLILQNKILRLHTFQHNIKLEKLIQATVKYIYISIS